MAGTVAQSLTDTCTERNAFQTIHQTFVQTEVCHSYLVLVREVVNVGVEGLSFSHLVLTPEGATAQHRGPPVSHCVHPVPGQGGGGHIGPDIFGLSIFVMIFLGNYFTWSPARAEALSM